MRASVDGFKNSTFHSICDNKGPTLVIIKANNRVFGGYTKLAWDTSGGWKGNDPTAFIFRVTEGNDNNDPQIETFEIKD